MFCFCIFSAFSTNCLGFLFNSNSEMDRCLTLKEINFIYRITAIQFCNGHISALLSGTSKRYIIRNKKRKTLHNVLKYEPELNYFELENGYKLDADTVVRWVY